MFSGAYAILYAFFDATNRLDRAAMRRKVEGSITAGAHGIAALGLATQVAKLSRDERHQIMDWVAEDVAGRVPVAFTIFGATAEEQIAEAHRARSAGANWLIHQPPPKDRIAPERLGDFFAEVIGTSGLPAGIQNAPAYLGIGLDMQGVTDLARRVPSLKMLKGEGPAIEIAETIAGLGPGFPVFNGRGGLELIDNLRAGCAGVIVAPDAIDVIAHAIDAYRGGRLEEADVHYRRALPTIVFVMQSLDTLITYGKRLTALRLGLGPVHDRAPVLGPTAFGLEVTERLARDLGRLP
ncbi:dihydrodipicolinate synthase family protein [Nordella sp. HKS 07]|uniref:dihydrodipicolinate synthase family protein n=1 Tax=Nordella sp. HKS 07 TaxID=2712222 RepID=UPI0013E153F0|nr:dihydrodipicolinate synthase family protein [Nordella sp. HKS 07]QIG47235.1 dihydrodipicolinate synthase family protein [Nordella sp. HKS 07]